MAQLTLRPLANTRNGAIAAAALITIIGTWLAVAATTRAPGTDKLAESETVTQGHREGALYYPAPKQWASLTIVPVGDVVFRTEHLTEGKISVDEDRATLVFSPYSGRVTKLLAKPGDMVKAGQPLFTVEAPDMVQAQNDFITAISNLNKARSALDLAKIVEQQNKTLFDSRAGPLRDLQTSQATTRATENDVRSAQTSLEVMRNRLRILGMTDEEITKFSDTGAVSPQMTIYSPIAGNTSTPRRRTPAQAIRPSSSAISPPCGWSPTCASPMHQACTWARQSTSPFSRIRTRYSLRIFLSSQPRSIPERGVCWSGRRSTIRGICFVRKCLRA